jgi:tRNA (uracil-5-)-methyltransferase
VTKTRTPAFAQLDDTFSQSNAGIAEHMLTWAVAAARAPDGDASDGLPADASASASALPLPLLLPPAREDDLLELYCGSGNFTVALAPSFRRVMATEVSKAAVGAAEHNLAANGVANVQLGRVSAEELRAALEGVRPFERLKHIDLPALRMRTVLVDPPRAGCGAEVSPFLARFHRIIYISCNPVTMAEDVKRLEATHRIVRFALFDQFPYTPHLECGALLVAREEGAGVGAAAATAV